jgi:hypothetical protein
MLICETIRLNRDPAFAHNHPGARLIGSPCSKRFALGAFFFLRACNARLLILPSREQQRAVFPRHQGERLRFIR